MTPPFPYRPLDPNLHEIRLLSFTSPTPSSPNTISLTLIHHSLPPQPPNSSSLLFTALSYVWGTPTPPQTILINNHPFLVTPNLFSALTRLRNQNFGAKIWIDAICINQSDIPEKNFQVARMAEIYSSAEQVWVWLGKEGDGGALAGMKGLVGFWRKFKAGMEGEGLGEGERNARVEGFVRTVRGLAVASQTAGGAGSRGFGFEAIWRVFRERKWWTRVWIIQEVVLAREAVMFCGEDPEGSIEIGWEDVREFLRVMEWMVLFPSTAEEHRRLYQIVGDVYLTALHLSTTTDDLKRNPQGMTVLEIMENMSRGNGLGDVIQATDSRDMVYGLLGMVRAEDRVKIPVDYGPDMTLSKVLFAAAKVLLDQIGPSLLYWVRKTSLWEKGLPSWVPDWTTPPMSNIGALATRPGVFTASKGAQSESPPDSRIDSLSFTQPVISVRGVVLGRVAKTGGELLVQPNSPSYITECGTWLRELCVMVDESTLVVDEMWRVPIADFGLTSRAEKENSTRFRHGFGVLTGQVPPPEELENEEKLAWIASESWDYRRVWRVVAQRAFVDDGGRPGLGPGISGVGDHIAVLSGCNVPLILREKQRTGDSHLRFQVVGPAYVYGLMDGEAVTGDTAFSDIQLV